MRTALMLAVLGVCVGAAEFSFAGEKVVTDSWYTWVGRRDMVGSVHLVRKSTGKADAPVSVRADFEVVAGGKRLALQFETFAKDDECLTPVAFSSRGQGDDEFKSFDAAVTWTKDGDTSVGTLRTAVNGRERTMTLPDRTVEMWCMFEIVRRLPFDAEKPFEFHSLEGCELNLKKNHKLAYVGHEEAVIGDKKQALHQFEETGDGIRPVKYWVNDKHELVRVLMDDSKEFLLVTEDEAKKATGAGKTEK